MKKDLLLFLLLIFCGNIIAQQTYRGQVKDGESGESLIGVTIIVKDKDIGTTTDLDGNYVIDAQPGDILEFTFIGYTDQTVKLGVDSEVNVILPLNVNALDEVVVVGYGLTKKKDLTGSVSTIRPDEIEGMPVASSELLLQGRSSGVEVMRNDGAPGSGLRIRIRGVNSINSGNDPLVVVDGFLGGNLDQINPNDIERIDILKDASALAIYGARASNGVILVTTKSGKEGNFGINLSYSKSYQDITKKIDVLGSQDYGYFVNEAYQNDGDVRPYPIIGSRRFPIRPEDIDYNVDWHDEVYRQGSIDDYQLSFSGATEKISYFISGGYFDQAGIVLNSDYKRYNARVNLRGYAKEWLEVGTNMVLSRKEYLGENGLFNGAGISNQILGYSPLFEPRDTSGNWLYDRLAVPQDNPLAVATIPVPLSELKQDYLNPKFYGNFTFLPSLTLKVSGGFEYGTRRHGQAFLQESIRGSNITSLTGNNGQAWVNTNESLRFLNENVLTFSNTFFNKHSVTALAGYSRENSQFESYSASVTGFVSDAAMFGYHALNNGDQINSANSGFSTRAFESFFGRLNYDFGDKYAMTINGRYDGASVFAKGNKFAFFPSAAIAWKLHNEQFMQNVPFVSEAKIRVSYGRIGNAEIPAFSSLSRFVSSNGVLNNNITTIVFVPATVANPNLTWETTTQLDLGIDLGLMQDRFTITADFYDKVTDDLLLAVDFPATSGFRRGLSNVGSVSNRGFELSLYSRNLTGALTWSTNFNFSRNRNKILSLSEDVDRIFVGNAVVATALNTNLNILQVGQPISTYYGLVYDGVVTEADTEAELGRAKYKDIDGEAGELLNDRTIIGSAFPDYLWGMTNNFSFAGFDLGIFLQASSGADLYNLTRQRLETLNPSSNISQEAYDNRTRKVDGEYVFTDIPRASAFNQMRPSSRFIEDGSFIRLQNVSLSYTLPQPLTKRMNLNKLTIYASGQNLYLWTNYKGYDPEVTRFKGSDTQLGIDDGSYPNVRGYTFGIKLGL